MKLCHVEFSEVASLENLCEAWQEFIRGKRRKKDVSEFLRNLGDELVSLHQELMNGRYRHGSYQYFAINDPKPRSIHKASVRDRLLHHAIHRKLYPYFVSRFIADSFSCQSGKGLHRGLDRFHMMARQVSQNNTRTCWILKCDIRKFFSSVDHDILLNVLRGLIADKRLMNLLEVIIRSFETAHGKGIPLGNLTSQLFANVYMNELDQFVKHDLRMKNYARYADDFVFLSSDRSELIYCVREVSAFLTERLALRLHPEKVFITTYASGIDFLGWIHFPYYRIPRTKTKRRALKRIRQRPTDATMQSYLGLLKHGDTFELQERMLNDFWLWSSCLYLHLD